MHSLSLSQEQGQEQKHEQEQELSLLQTLARMATCDSNQIGLAPDTLRLSEGAVD